MPCRASPLPGAAAHHAQPVQWLCRSLPAFVTSWHHSAAPALLGVEPHLSSCALPLVPWPCGCACAAAALPLLLVDTRGGYPWRIAPSARVLGLSILIVLSSLMCHLSFFPCHLLCRLMRSSLARYLVFVPCVAESPALISQDFRCTGASPLYVSHG